MMMGALESIAIAPVPVEQAASKSAITTFPGPKDRPRFIVLDHWAEIDGKKHRPGVHHCGMTEAKGDNDPSPVNIWICSPIRIEAVTFDGQENNFGRLLRFRNSIGHWREWAMPMELLRGGGDEMRGELLAMGVHIDPQQHRLLTRYLQSETPKRRVHCALQVGWTGKSFVLPDQVIGPNAADVIFQSGERERGQSAFTQAGTLEGWRDGIARLASGNPLLLLALSAGFAGPLLERCHAESGGFHLMEDSSTGKTTAVEAACSIWGGPDYRRSWRATANGVEAAAALFNDALLALDEISECDPSEIGAIVYALGNGRGKQRANRSGSARSVTRWRCMVLSSGERSIGTTMEEGGHRIKAGQSVRLLNIPSARKHGAWDELHGYPSGSALSDAVKRAAATHYGHAGRAFLDKLTRDERDFCAVLEEVKGSPAFTIEGGEGQEKRAAARFALIGLAGELATEYGLTGWEKDEAVNAAAECLKLWQSQRGKGNDERQQALDHVSAFIQRHGDSRFSSIKSDPHKPQVHNRAGWWEGTESDRVYLFTAEGMREALKGLDFRRALDYLQAAGALPSPGADGERARFKRIGGQGAKLYAIHVEKLDGSPATNAVSPVAAVQTSRDGRLGCNGNETAGVSDVSEDFLEPESDTADTGTATGTVSLRTLAVTVLHG
jgi:putative DNA primase/helicase